MSNQFPESTNKNWAIAIVHGLGTPEPGETREAVCKGIQEIKRDFAPDEVLGKSNDCRTAFSHDWAVGEGRAKVAEVFWGDLSLVRGTIPDMIRAMCSNLYGAVYVNSRALQRTSKFTRFLPIIPFYLVRWIVLPLHLVAVCLAVPSA